MREHGTYTMYRTEDCRCAACRAAKVAYERRRRRQMAYGTWKPYVDAAPVRQHVRRLQATGMGWKRIAREAGISTSVVWKLLHGCPQRNMAPSKRVRQATADAILAVTPTLTPGQRIDAATTWERIYDLMEMGYSKAWISRVLGNHTPALQLGKRYTTVANAVAIKKLHDTTITRRPDDTHHELAAANRARNYAARNRKRTSSARAGDRSWQAVG